MKISTFTKFSAQNSVSPTQAFIDGARKIGWTVVDHDLSADAAMIWSVLWNGRMRKNFHVYQHFRQQGRPVFVLDVGSLHRDRTWKLALNNLNAQGCYGHEENLDWDRPEKLGISLQHPTKNNGKILICLQHQHSQQLATVGDLSQWVVTKIQQIQNHSDRPIFLRPHPRARFNPAEYKFSYQLNRPTKIKHSYDSYDFSPQQYHAVINCNSSPGILAAIQGVRPIVDSTSLAFSVSVDAENIDHDYLCDRDRWLVSITHTEYSLEELRQPLWEKRLLPYLNL